MGIPATDLATWEQALSDREWRLSNLYWIIDKEGREVRFVPNATQRELLADTHNRRLVLKSRQHGITTVASLVALDTALFRSNTSCGIVMHKREDAEKVFRQKILFAYERLPEIVRKAMPIVSRDNTGRVEFKNGSRIEVSLSHRGGTLQFLHVSEYGPMCAMYPQRAAEVKSGALNTVGTDCIVTIESTSYGGFGDFHDMCKAAMAQEALVKAGAASMSPLDYTLHFFAWWQDPKNRLDPAGVVVTKEDDAYFERVESEIGQALDAGQRAWYVKKAAEQGDAMLREQPSTPKEAFQAAIEGGYYTAQMSKARGEGRIGSVPHDVGTPVDTYWDLGFNDSTALWFRQAVGLQNRFIRTYQAQGEHLPHYVAYLQTLAAEEGYVYGTHYLPHDAEAKRLGSDDIVTMLRRLMPGQRFEVVPRIENLYVGIQQTRLAFSSCWFDATQCADGIQALDAYRKHYDAKHGIFTSEPEHDEFSHYADAFRQFGQTSRAAQAGIKPPAWQQRLKQMRAARSHRKAMSA